MPFHTRYSHWLQSPSRKRTKDNTQTHTQAIWSWDITPWVTYQSALELWNMNPEKEVIWWNQRKAPPRLPKALKFLTAFPNSFWQIVTTIQVEKKTTFWKIKLKRGKVPTNPRSPQSREGVWISFRTPQSQRLMLWSRERLTFSTADSRAVSWHKVYPLELKKKNQWKQLRLNLISWHTQW